jgi:hypothetical protein
MFLLMILLPSLLIVSFPSSKTRGLRIVTKDGKGIQLYEKSYALVIGVSKYTKGWQALESIPKEIDEVEVALKKHGFKVKKVLNPSYENLKRAFDDFINEYGFNPSNRLLFFFSGHGYTRKRGKKGYIVPSDAPNPVYNERGFVQKSVEMEQVITWARRIEAKHALFLFDSCFSGLIFKAKDTPVPRHISYLTANDVRQFISAGSAGQKVPAKSVFTPSFIRGINGEADLDKDGYITGTELGLYLQKKVLSYRKGQTPQYGKIRDPDYDEGDFVFLSNKKKYEPPKKFKEVDFSDMEVEAEWSKWQNNFEIDVDKAKEYEKNSGISAGSKKSAWVRVLDAYSEENPFSDKDEQLRDYVKDRILHWKHLEATIELVADRVAFNGSSKFPERIEYKLFKGGNFVGKCQYLYSENTNKKGISSLKLTNFQGFGYSSDESLVTYIFRDNLSLYADFVMKGRKVISERRLKEAMGFDLKKTMVLIYKSYNSPDEIQIEIPTRHKVIDLVSSFFVASQMVAKDNYKQTMKFNILFGRRIRVVDTIYIGKSEVAFQGRMISTEIFVIRYNNVELCRFYIFKDYRGNCYPIRIVIQDRVLKTF